MQYCRTDFKVFAIFMLKNHKNVKLGKKCVPFREKIRFTIGLWHCQARPGGPGQRVARVTVAGSLPVEAAGVLRDRPGAAAATPRPAPDRDTPRLPGAGANFKLNITNMP